MRHTLWLLQLILLLLLGGCAYGFGEAAELVPAASTPEPQPEPEAAPASAPPPLSEAQVQNHYAALNLELLYSEPSEDKLAYLVAYWQADGSLACELYEGGGGRTALTTLHELPRAVVLPDTAALQIISALDPPTGSQLRGFPSRFYFYRLADGGYHQEIRPYLAPLEQDYSLGQGASALLQGLRLTHNGLELEFQSGPLPLIECSFDAASGSGLLTLYDTQNDLPYADLQNNSGAGAVQRFTLSQAGSNLYLQLYLHPEARYYSLEHAQTLHEAAAVRLQLFSRAGD